MATFYLLPARPQIGKQFGELLSGLFPGVAWPRALWNDLAEALAGAAQVGPNIYVIFAEDIPDDRPLEQALALYFGAETGDEIVSVQTGARLGAVESQRWTFGAVARAA